MKIRVHMADGTVRDYDATRTQVAPDGSLLLDKTTYKKAVIAGAADEITFRLVRVIRRDLWLEVESVEDGTPAEAIHVGNHETALAGAGSTKRRD